MIFTRDRNSDRRRYSILNVDEVAMVFYYIDRERPFEKDSEIFLIWIIKKIFYIEFNRHY